MEIIDVRTHAEEKLPCGLVLIDVLALRAVAQIVESGGDDLARSVQHCDAAGAELLHILGLEEVIP